MQVISSTEFATHYNKYLDMAIDHDLRIKRGQNMFQITYQPIVEEQAVLQPDADLRRAITMDELRDRVLNDIDNFYANK